ncbi:hypothetical protein CEUSTIGMA_g10418.t1 [Chlamydomonas eustigma]|uniref:Plastid lipid-associated protein/fibrillin conserved domain-containing protein n=1 Tax=Chlamydomonas eustigma TaxID=1157962 RepID=A0A250XIT2_9CHLO|nr:hypothetical protein CEUSTIGMA_g10418.t1 [Chlamydomonas eustigma]|eukprot:GAX82991.1 hypothetical protein CEUSTIGMA_g10418.t1 [Chlamydomonas eustigma]
MASISLWRSAIAPRFLRNNHNEVAIHKQTVIRVRPVQPLRVAAADFSEGAEESSAFVEISANDEMPLSDIKAALLDSMYGVQRGLAARSEIRAEINELISQLEAKNPTPNPTEVLEALTGDWKLIYTSNSSLMAVLALSRLPFVEVGDITQKIDSSTLTVENKVQLSVPFSRTAFSTTASFEVRSPKRLQLRLNKGGIQTPELLTDIELPVNVTVLGQALDLTQLKQALAPVNEQVKGVLGQVNNLMSQTPDLQFDIPSDRAQTWQLNTYVDEDTRISRGDGGSVFIYVREVSFK